MKRLSAILGAPVAPDPMITCVTADSREACPGALFAALRGGAADGAAFIDDAIGRGAVAVLVEAGADVGAASRAAPDVAIIMDATPRRRFAAIAARFFERQPALVAGVTGTNGKTSTVRFAAQLWEASGRCAGSLGTLGALAPGFERKLAHTTPAPALLHRTLAEMVDAGVEALAMEVSSHALSQHRADGVRFAIAAFTNITQDHLDYHIDFATYFDAKARLFTDLLEPGGVAVVNADGAGADDLVARLAAGRRRVMTTGAKGRDVRLVTVETHAAGQRLAVECGGRRFAVDFALFGPFQAENALLAAGVVIASGEDPATVIGALGGLVGAPGRMQPVAGIRGARIFIDYAHTPAAIETAIAAARGHAAGKVVTLIGAGGDRDRGKRPLMGAAAAAGADTVIVTDDNPRSEDPAAIRAAVLEGAPGAIEIGDRRAAIAHGVSLLGAGDVFLITGKGHETGQVVGDCVLPFDDAVEARAAALALGGEEVR